MLPGPLHQVGTLRPLRNDYNDDDDPKRDNHDDIRTDHHNHHHHFDKFKHNDRGPLWGRFLRNFGRLERLQRDLFKRGHLRAERRLYQRKRQAFIYGQLHNCKFDLGNFRRPGRLKCGLFSRHHRGKLSGPGRLDLCRHYHFIN